MNAESRQTSARVRAMLIALLTPPFGLLACAVDDDGGCQTDGDCKGERICVDAHCVDRAQEDDSAAKQSEQSEQSEQPEPSGGSSPSDDAGESTQADALDCPAEPSASALPEPSSPEPSPEVETATSVDSGTDVPDEATEATTFAECAPCQNDDECDTGLVCGRLDSVDVLLGEGGFCAPPEGVTECCAGNDNVALCLDVRGNWHGSQPECDASGCTGDTHHLGACLTAEAGFTTCSEYCESIGEVGNGDSNACGHSCSLRWAELDEARCNDPASYDVRQLMGLSGSCSNDRDAIDFDGYAMARCCCQSSEAADSDPFGPPTMSPTEPEMLPGEPPTMPPMEPDAFPMEPDASPMDPAPFPEPEPFPMEPEPFPAEPGADAGTR